MHIESFRGVMDNVVDCDPTVNELEPLSRYEPTHPPRLSIR